MDYSDTPDVYSFDEDSGDVLSPQQPNSQPSPSQSSPSLKDSRETEVTYDSSDFCRPPQVQKYLQLCDQTYCCHVTGRGQTLQETKLNFDLRAQSVVEN